MAKTEKLFSKVIIIIFLVMLVLGFVIPSILNNSSSDSAIEPRLCNNDADCYLLCEEKPLKVLCLQNLCAVNSCEEKPYYEYDQNPSSFRIDIKNVTLEERSDNKNIFVTFKGNTVQSFSPKLSLYYVLEKTKIILDTQCLTFDLKQYCSNDLHMTVNGENSTAFGNYIPKEGDMIEIEY